MLISRVERCLNRAGIEYEEVLQVWQGNCTEALAEVLVDIPEDEVKVYWIRPSGVHEAEAISKTGIVNYINLCNE